MNGCLVLFGSLLVHGCGFSIFCKSVMGYLILRATGIIKKKMISVGKIYKIYDRSIEEKNLQTYFITFVILLVFIFIILEK